MESGKKHIYIKEGAIIGHTYTQEKANTAPKDVTTTDENGNESSTEYEVGNYIRIIFRDTNEQVVENVEDYIEIEEPETTSVYAEGIDIEFMAGVITAEAGTSQEGWIATSWVIRNRLESGRFGASLAEILVAPQQFVVVSTTPEGITGHLTGGVISMEVNGTTYYVTAPEPGSIEVAQGVLAGEYPNPIGGRLYWKSAGTNVDASKNPIQIPAGTGNKFHD